MRALLLAAGLGTRLRPLTDVLPKCLAPIHGRPLLDYWLDNLLAAGASEILVNSHHLDALVAEFLDKSGRDRQVRLVYEEKLLGTGGTMLKNRAYFGEEAFLVAHADNLSLFDARSLLQAHRARPEDSDMTMMLFETDDPRSCGIVELDERGIVAAFHEKVAAPPGRLANAAVYVLEPAVLDLLASLGKEEIDFSTEIIPRLLGRVCTWRTSAYHRDIGSMESWRQANREFPMIPGRARSVAAWAAMLAANDGRLSKTIERLAS